MPKQITAHQCNYCAFVLSSKSMVLLHEQKDCENFQSCQDCAFKLSCIDVTLEECALGKWRQWKGYSRHHCEDWEKR